MKSLLIVLSLIISTHTFAQNGNCHDIYGANINEAAKIVGPQLNEALQNNLLAIAQGQTIYNIRVCSVAEGMRTTIFKTTVQVFFTGARSYTATGSEASLSLAKKDKLFKL
jgi:hypothetical protein